MTSWLRGQSIKAIYMICKCLCTHLGASKYIKQILTDLKIYSNIIIVEKFNTLFSSG